MPTSGLPLIPIAAGAEIVSLERMSAYPFFSRSSQTILRKLQPHLTETRLPAGAHVMRLGEYHDAAFYLAEGTVEVVVPRLGQAPAVGDATPSPPTGFVERVRRILTRRGTEAAGPRPPSRDRAVAVPGVPVDLRLGEKIRLEAGEIFGEISALSRYPVTADVHAATEVLLLKIRTPGLRLMFKQPELAAFKEFIDGRYRARTLASHLRQVELLREIGEPIIERLRLNATLHSYDPGQTIVEQGEEGRAFYLVRGGHIKVSTRHETGDLAVTYLRKGDYAGEVALLTGEPWPFSLRALEHVELVEISREDFDAVLAAEPLVEHQLREAVALRLKQIELTSSRPSAAEPLQMAMDTGLMNGQSVLLIDLNTCTGCDDCVRACADTHGGLPRLIRNGRIFRHWNIPRACYHCSDPVCMIGCPTGAISRPLGSLEVTIDRETCIGCGNCASRCPWGTIITVPYASPILNREIQLATKCDLCIGRDEGPACVQMCPHGSAVRISFGDPEALTALFLS